MRQKEIWLINLDLTLGAEISKTRPCVLLSDDAIGALPLKVIAPITEFKEKYEQVPWMIKLTPNAANQLEKTSVIDTFQVRSVSKTRLIRQIGAISDKELQETLDALKPVFGMAP
jgi:mRNA interferase MazF